MAEDSPPPSEDQQSRGRPLNPGQSQTIDRVEVTRLDAQTGEIHNLETDLLNEICECIDEQTQTLGKKFVQMQREIVKALERQRKDRGKDRGAKEEETAKKKSIKSHADLAKQLGITEDEAKKLTLGMKDLTKNTKEASSALDAFASIGVIMRGLTSIWQEFQEELEFSKTGLVDLTDSLMDLGAGMREQRFTTVQSFKAMQEAIDRGAMPAIGTLGSNLQEVGHELFTFQDRIKTFGFEFAEAMDFREMSAATIQLLDLEKRANVQAGIRDIQTERSIANQLSLLQDIALFSGKTVDALLKENQQALLDIENLVATGAISKEEGDLYQAVIAHLGPDSPLGQIALEAANKGGIQLAAATSETVQQMIAQGHPLVDLLNRVQFNTKAMHSKLEEDQTEFLASEVNDRMKESNIVLSKGLLFALASSKELAAIAGQTNIIAQTDIRAAKDAHDREKAEDPLRTSLDAMAQEALRQFHANVPELILNVTKDILTVVAGIKGLVQTGFKQFLGIGGGGGGGIAATTATAATTAAATTAAAKAKGAGKLAKLAKLGGRATGIGAVGVEAATTPTDEIAARFSRLLPLSAAQMAITDFMIRRNRGEGVTESIEGAVQGAISPMSMGLVDQPEDDPFRGVQPSLLDRAFGAETVTPESTFDMAAAKETEKTLSSLASNQFDQTELTGQSVGFLQSLDVSNKKIAESMEKMVKGDPTQMAALFQQFLTTKGIDASNADATNLFSSLLK